MTKLENEILPNSTENCKYPADIEHLRAAMDLLPQTQQRIVRLWVYVVQISD